MITLFDGDYEPITSHIGFIQAPAPEVAQSFMDWQTPIQEKRSVKIELEHKSGQFCSALESLLPLTSVESRRVIFVQTKADWTAYFDNGARGADIFSRVSYLCKLLGCKGVRASYVPHTFEKKTGLGRYGSTQWEVYGPNAPGVLNIERSLAAANDGGKWVFVDQGIPMPFEDLDAYSNKVIKERFTPEMLGSYLRCMGIEAYNSDFYESEAGYYVASKIGPSAPKLVSYSLEEARRLNGIP
jgi:hypothetical protein